MSIRITRHSVFYSIAGFCIFVGSLAVLLVVMAVVFNFPYRGPGVLYPTARAHLFNIQKALASYRTEHGKYPLPAQRKALPPELERYGRKKGSVEKGGYLTTDLFSPRKEPLRYMVSTDSTNYLLVSMGPDEEFTIEESLVDRLPVSRELLIHTICPALYDPTNGTSSSGDIIATKERVWSYGFFVREFLGE